MGGEGRGSRKKFRKRRIGRGVSIEGRGREALRAKEEAIRGDLIPWRADEMSL